MSSADDAGGGAVRDAGIDPPAGNAGSGGSASGVGGSGAAGIGAPSGQECMGIDAGADAHDASAVDGGDAGTDDCDDDAGALR
jgi:hypothetical protein